jgi:drug/metabolite transporter (DMT)-like permease
MGLAEWAMLIALSLLWGGSFFFNGVAVKALPPLTLVLLRVVLAAVTLNVILILRGTPLPRDARVWTAFFGMGLLNNAIPFTLIAWGQSHIASGVASILNATTPLFAVIAAHFLTADEKMTPNRIGGVVAGFAGVVLMIGPSALAGATVNVWAHAAVLGAAACYSLAGIFGRRFKAMGVEPLATATGQVTASSLLLLPVAALVDRPWQLAMPGGAVWLSVAGLALLSTALGYLLFFRILSKAGATNIALVTFLIPVSAILLGALFLGEQLTARHFGGLAMIALGLAAIDGRPLRLLKWTPGTQHGR